MTSAGLLLEQLAHLKGTGCVSPVKSAVKRKRVWCAPGFPYPSDSFLSLKHELAVAFTGF